MGKATLTFEVDEALKAEFADAAKATDRTAEELLLFLMRDYVNRAEAEAEYDAWFRAEVQKGIDAAEAGDVISHEEMKAEMASWRAELLEKIANSKS